MLNKNILPLIFALVLFAFFPIIFSNCLLGDDIETLRSKVEIAVPGKTIVEKLNWVKSSHKQSGGKYLFEVTADESINPIELSYGENPNITIIFRGVGANRTISLSSNGEIYIHKSVTLVLDNNITLVGRSSNDRPLVKAGYGGTLIMNSGSTITGNTSDFVGGVIADGTFIMNGGTISGNKGRGVYVGGAYYGTQYASGIFTMTGGTISGNGNTSWAGGGVFVSNSGTHEGNYLPGGIFTMTGGTISGNTALDSGGGVYVNGAYTQDGTYYAGGTFTKTGGTITGYASDTVNGNRAESNNGHAVYASGNSVTKRRETTAGPEVNLSINGSNGTFSGAWEN